MGVTLSLALTLVDFRSIPVYFDYDDATQGVFTNDLTFAVDYDATFRRSEARQDAYRRNWATQRLPYSLVLSAAQRIFRIERYDVERLIGRVALAFAALGTLLAVRALLDEGTSSSERWAVFAFVAIHPSFILFTRTGASFYLLAYALFWAAIFLCVRYAATGHPRLLLGLAVVLAIFLLNPYPPLVCLVPAVPAILAIHGRLLATLRSRHLYLAIATTALLTIGLSAAIALRFEGSLASYGQKLAAFQRDRAHAISVEQLTRAPLSEKLTKLVDQHFLFATDPLGDPSRDDRVWTMGRSSHSFLATLPLMLIGGLVGLARRERSMRVCVAVLASIFGLFLTFSFPEGRYLLAAIPCYGFLVIRGVRALTPGPYIRRAALGAILSILALETAFAVRGYDRSVAAVWRPYALLRPAARILAPFRDETLLVRLPAEARKRLEPSIYFSMVMPPAARWVTPTRFEESLETCPPCVRVVAIEAEIRESEIDRLERLGFSALDRLGNSDSTQAMRILIRPSLSEPSCPAGSCARRNATGAPPEAGP
jgi:hypothetical protein